ncbi:hypothetical protein ACQ4M3_05605 [Leptolyngbya sp. AN03gr2]|uniref:hypothetical protein n=1 Tax=unclassified Leptolyngbya TaxID=2650499 RepID=UPI003D319A1C
MRQEDFYSTRLIHIIVKFLAALSIVLVIGATEQVEAAPKPRSTVAKGQIPYPNPITNSPPRIQQIRYGSVIPGVLAPGGFQFRGRFFDAYRFTARQGDWINVSLVGSEDSRLKLQPAFVLLNSANNVVAEGKQNPATINVSLKTKIPATGTYTIVVTSLRSGDIGRYSLALQRIYYKRDQPQNSVSRRPRRSR